MDKNKNNKKISRKKFLELWKNYDQFELIDKTTWIEDNDKENIILNVKGHIKAFMKTVNKNNDDKLDFIINQIKQMDHSFNSKINEINTKFDSKIDEISIQIKQMDHKFETKINEMDQKFESRINEMETNFISRFDNIENGLDIIEKDIRNIKLCPTISNELKNIH